MTQVQTSFRENADERLFERWLDPETTEVVLTIYRPACLMAGAEWLALGILEQLRSQRVKLSVVFHRDVKSADDFPIFRTLFGVALLFAASNSDEKVESARKNNWAWIQSRGQRITNGHYTAYVCREPDAVFPSALSSVGDNLPTSEQFRQLVQRELQAQQGHAGHGIADMAPEHHAMVEILFEAMTNAFEHGMLGNDGESTRRFRLWGMSLEKITRGSWEQLAPCLWKPIANLLGRRAGLVSTKDGLVELLSVTDLGQGIHNTLPKREREGRTDEECLRHAFTAKVTRKQNTGSIKYGLGLRNLQHAAESLRAVLLVRSGDLVRVHSFDENRGLLLSESPELQTPIGSIGTSIVIARVATVVPASDRTASTVGALRGARPA